MSTVQISAADVNKLRLQTGAGMMDCKKALTEANGDFEAAIDLLRKKGQKVSAARSGNTTAEGIVLVNLSADGTNGKLVALACETEPVSKSLWGCTLKILNPHCTQGPMMSAKITVPIPMGPPRIQPSKTTKISIVPRARRKLQPLMRLTASIRLSRGPAPASTPM